MQFTTKSTVPMGFHLGNRVCLAWLLICGALDCSCCYGLRVWVRFLWRAAFWFNSWSAVPWVTSRDLFKMDDNINGLLGLIQDTLLSILGQFSNGSKWTCLENCWHTHMYTLTLHHVDQGNSKFLSISIYSYFISVWDFWNWTKHWRLCSREWPERLSCKSITALWLFWCKGKIPVEVYSSLRSQVSKEADKVTGECFLVFQCNHRDRGNTKEVTYQGHSSWGRKSVLGWFLCNFGWVNLAYAFDMAFYFFFLILHN